MSAMKGMNVEEVQTFASNVKGTHIETVQSAITACLGNAEALQWVGPDFNNFVSNEVADVRTKLETLVGSLTQLATSAETNAQAQDTTSAS